MSEKCKFHPITPSPKCRNCKSNLPVTLTNTTSCLKKPESRHGPMPVWGDKNTWNISSLMRKNVFSSVYFNKELFHLRDLASVLEEIDKHVRCIEPWVKGTCNSPSSLFCILIKLFIMKLSEGQIRFVLDNPSPFTKVTGILYIRFLADPAELWERLKDLTLVNQEIPESHLTISTFISKVLIEQDYFSMQLPRIPSNIQAILSQKVAEITLRQERLLKNLNKAYEKDSKVFVYLESPVEGIFKSKDGNKAHVQVDGKDIHVHLSDIDNSCVSSILITQDSKVFADNKEYCKRSVSYKESLTFKLPEKRQRSPSPEQKKIITKVLEKVSVSSNISDKVDDLSEIFKLG